MITIRYSSQGKLEVGVIGIILTKEGRKLRAQSFDMPYNVIS
jgi:hypothetical protein